VYDSGVGLFRCGLYIDARVVKTTTIPHSPNLWIKQLSPHQQPFRNLPPQAAQPWRVRKLLMTDHPNRHFWQRRSSRHIHLPQSGFTPEFDVAGGDMI